MMTGVELPQNFLLLIVVVVLLFFLLLKLMMLVFWFNVLQGVLEVQKEKYDRDEVMKDVIHAILGHKGDKKVPPLLQYARLLLAIFVSTTRMPSIYALRIF